MTRKSIYLPGPACQDSRQHQLVPDAAVRGQFLYTSGIAGYDAAGHLPETNEAQAGEIYRRMMEILQTAGYSTEEIGHLFVWALERHPVIGGKVTKFINPYWEKMFPDIRSRPARHVLGRVLDAGQHYKLEITATKNAKRTSYEINDEVYHTGGSTTKGYMPFGITIGKYLYTGPTYGMTLKGRKMGDTHDEQARLCAVCNDEFYRMAGQSADNLAHMFVWYHDAEGRRAAVDYTEVMFPDRNDRPAIHYLKSHLPFWHEVNGQFWIQYDNTGVGGERRKPINPPGVRVLDGAGGHIPAGVAMGDTLFTSVITGTGTIEEQAREAFRSARAVVEAGGFEWRDVGHVYVWYDDHACRDVVDKVWAECFPDKTERPARNSILEPEMPAGTSVGIEIRAAR